MRQVFALAAAAVLAAALFLLRSPDRQPEVGDTAPNSPSTPGSGAPESDATTTDLAPVTPEQRRAVGAPSEPQGSGMELTLDPALRLRGRVIPNAPLPPDEELWATLRAPVLAPAGTALELCDELPPAGDKRWYWSPVARARVDQNTTFSLPRPAPGEAEFLHVSVKGQFVPETTRSFSAGSRLDPGDSEWAFHVEVGAHVTLDFSGSFTDEDCRALAGRRVDLFSAGPSAHEVFSSSTYRFSGTLEANGRVPLGATLPYSWRILEPMEDADRGLGTWRVPIGFRFEPAPGETLVVPVPLLPRRTLEGVVVDEASKPVQGASVAIRKEWVRANGTWSASPERLTGANGRFTFESVPRTIDRITVSAENCMDLILEGSTLEALLWGPSELELRLTPGHSLTVVVTASGGRPAAGAGVEVWSTSGGSEFSVTGADGTTRIDGLGSGSVLVRALGGSVEAPPLDPSGQRDAAVAFSTLRSYQTVPWVDKSGQQPLYHDETSLDLVDASSHATVELELVKAPTLRGELNGPPADQSDLGVRIERDPSRDPLPGSGEMTLREASLRQTIAVDPATRTFAVQMIPGSYRAFLVHPGRQAIRASDPTTFEVAESDVSLALRVPVQSALRGQVTDAAGAPLPGVTVRAFRAGNGFYQYVSQASSDAQGAFELLGLAPSLYRLQIESRSHAATSVHEVKLDVDAPPPFLEVVLVPGGAIRPLLIGPSGEPDTAAGVNILDAAGDPLWVGTLDGDSFAPGARGPIAPGDYEVVWRLDRGEGAQLFVHGQAAVKAGEVTEVTLEQPATAPARLRGLVQSDGEAVDGLSVWLVDRGLTVATGRTSTSGQFHLASASTGPLELRLGTSWFDTFETLEVQVSPGEATLQPIELPTGSVHGTMEGDRRAFRPWLPTLRRVEDSSSAAPERRTRSIRGDRFEFAYVRDGRYVLTLENELGEAAPGWPPVKLEVRDGRPTRGVTLRQR